MITKLPAWIRAPFAQPSDQGTGVPASGSVLPAAPVTERDDTEMIVRAQLADDSVWVEGPVVIFSQGQRMAALRGLDRLINTDPDEAAKIIAAAGLGRVSLVGAVMSLVGYGRPA